MSSLWEYPIVMHFCLCFKHVIKYNCVICSVWHGDGTTLVLVKKAYGKITKEVPGIAKLKTEFYLQLANQTYC